MRAIVPRAFLGSSWSSVPSAIGIGAEAATAEHRGAHEFSQCGLYTLAWQALPIGSRAAHNFGVFWVNFLAM